jgi:hypothetical protein
VSKRILECGNNSDLTTDLAIAPYFDGNLTKNNEKKELETIDQLMNVNLFSGIEKILAKVKEHKKIADL